MFPDMQRIWTYVRRRWFQLLVLGLVLFVLLKKDLSFQVQLNTPLEEEQPVQPVEPEKYSVRLQEKEEKAPDGNKLGLSSLPEEDYSRFDMLRAVRDLDPAEVEEFIERFAHVARAEEKKFGIPAAITLGHALLICKAGTSMLIAETRNYFALPCTPDWKGPRSSYDGSCLRKYPNAWTSFRDHSLFLTTGPHADLKQYSGGSFQEWLGALDGRGIGQIPDYDRQMRAVVQAFRLDRF
jgi:hypothetical protein